MYYVIHLSQLKVATSPWRHVFRRTPWPWPSTASPDKTWTPFRFGSKERTMPSLRYIVMTPGWTPNRRHITKSQYGQMTILSSISITNRRRRFLITQRAGKLWYTRQNSAKSGFRGRTVSSSKPKAVLSFILALPLPILLTVLIFRMALEL